MEGPSFSTLNLPIQPIRVGKAQLEQVEEVPMENEAQPSGNGLSGNKRAIENPQEENPNNPERLDNGQKISEQEVQESFWQRLSKLQKGLIIGGVIISVVALVVGLSLMGVALSWKPTVVVTPGGSLSTPNTKQYVSLKTALLTDKNLLSKDVSATVEVAALEGGTVELEGAEGVPQQADDLPPGVITINKEESGIVLLAESPTDLEVQINLDKAVETYSKKNLIQARRLLMVLEMRLLQEEVLMEAPLETAADPENNVLALDDAPSLLAGAEKQMIMSVAAATNIPVDELTIDYIETATGVLNSQGQYVLEQDDGYSSRLLYAMNQLRHLSEWEALFQDITSKVIETELRESVNIIKEYGSTIAESSGISFSPDTVLEVYNQQEVPACRLQGGTTPTATNQTAPTVPSASNTSTASNTSAASNATSNSTTTSNSTSTNSTAKNGSSQSKSSDSKESKTKKKRVLKPIRGRRRGKNGKKRIVSNETREGGKCRGPRRRRTCSLSEFKKANSTHRANALSMAKPKRNPCHFIRHNKTEAIARRKILQQRKRKYQQSKKKRENAAPTPAPTPVQIDPNPKTDPKPAQTPISPTVPSTPTLQVAAP